MLRTEVIAASTNPTPSRLCAICGRDPMPSAEPQERVPAMIYLANHAIAAYDRQIK
jgi:hypothetical protein